MASSSGNSSQIHQSRSDDGLMDQRKRKRMESNRESARRSRMRKQKHIDDLIAESTKIKNDNDKIRTTINLTTEQSIKIEAENSVLRAQVNELTQRLNSLNEIMNYINTNAANSTTNQYCSGDGGTTSGFFEFDYMETPWNMMYVNQQQPIMASADMFGY